MTTEKEFTALTFWKTSLLVIFAYNKDGSNLTRRTINLLIAGRRLLGIVMYFTVCVMSLTSLMCTCSAYHTCLPFIPVFNKRITAAIVTVYAIVIAVSSWFFFVNDFKVAKAKEEIELTRINRFEEIAKHKFSGSDDSFHVIVESTVDVERRPGLRRRMSKDIALIEKRKQQGRAKSFSLDLLSFDGNDPNEGEEADTSQNVEIKLEEKRKTGKTKQSEADKPSTSKKGDEKYCDPKKSKQKSISDPERSSKTSKKRDEKIPETQIASSSKQSFSKTKAWDRVARKVSKSKSKPTNV